MLDGGPGEWVQGAYGHRLDSRKRYMGRLPNQGFLLDGPMSDVGILQSLWVNCPPDMETSYQKFCDSEKYTPRYKRKRQVALRAIFDFSSELKGGPMGFFTVDTLFYPFKFEQGE
jgi:hypothetical protein